MSRSPVSSPTGRTRGPSPRPAAAVLPAVLPAGHPARTPADDAPPRWGAPGTALTAAGLTTAALAAGAGIVHLNEVAAPMAAASATLVLGALWVRAADRARTLARAGVRAGALGAALLTLGACAGRSAPRVASTTFTPSAFEPRPADAPVRLYQATRPACAFDEIGAVKVKGGDFKDADRLAEAMRQRVRAMGGDAIVNFGKQEVVTGQTGFTNGGGMMMGGGPWMGGPWVGGWPGPVMQDVRNDKTLVMTGTVVRFRDAECAARTDRSTRSS